MKIIQVIPWFGMGGAEIMCENLTNALTEMGHQVIVISLYNKQSVISNRMEKNGINIKYLDKKKGFDISMFFKIKKILKAEKPDVIHTHLYSIKYAMIAAIFTKIPKKIHTVHSIAQKEAGKASKIVNKWLFKHHNVTPVALSKVVKNTIIDVYKIKNDKIPIIFNGVPLDKCIIKNNYQIDSCINVVHVGRFSEVKNHIEMVKAAMILHQTYTNIIFSFIGDGELKENIKNLIQENHAEDYIKVLGATDNIYPFLTKADLFLLPSIYEGMPMSIIEAMGTGLPIVASNVGGIPDMIKDMQNGLLCDPNDISIAAKLDKFINDQQLRELCGKNALLSSNRFSAKLMALEYLKLYS